MSEEDDFIERMKGLPGVRVIDLRVSGKDQDQDKEQDAVLFDSALAHLKDMLKGGKPSISSLAKEFDAAVTELVEKFVKYSMNERGVSEADALKAANLGMAHTMGFSDYVIEKYDPAWALTKEKNCAEVIRRGFDHSKLHDEDRNSECPKGIFEMNLD